ncbi:MAG: hypothetical protein PUH21_06350 [Prevotellaceae bacterium]|nr:hypothetical protein [Prevotellaceae bacterium]MDY3857177.1 hypothetical protein [Bacteroidaceae bacterium]
MNLSKQTIQQLDELFGELEKHYSPGSDSPIMTDISFQAHQDSGELTAYDDDDQEIASEVIDEWIDYPEANFNEVVRETLKQYLRSNRERVLSLSIIHPFSFVLVDGDLETVSDIYQVDDDSIMIEHEELMKGLDQDLNAFITKLLKE